MKKGEIGGLYKGLEMKIREKRSVELSENIKGRQLCSVSLLVGFVHAVGVGGCDGCGVSLDKKKLTHVIL